MQIPPTIICPVCGLRNDVTVRFCRNCGLPLGAPRDPVRGTTTRRADLPSDRGTGIAAIIGLLAVVGIVGVAGFLIFRGFQGTAVTANASPLPSLVGPASVAPAPTPRVSLPVASVGPASSIPPRASTPPATGDPTPAPDPTGSPSTAGPSATDGPGPTKRPRPTDEPTATAEAVATVSRWTCKSGSIADPLKGKWRISRTSWTSGTSTDRLTFTLSRMSGSSKQGTTVDMTFMSPGKAGSSLGISRPQGERAVVITFDGPTSIGTPQVGIPNLRVIESVDVRKDDSGVTHAVIGLSAGGCARLSAPDWKDGSVGTQTANVVLDVRR